MRGALWFFMHLVFEPRCTFDRHALVGPRFTPRY
jgi:hypothetical protein